MEAPTIRAAIEVRGVVASTRAMLCDRFMLHPFRASSVKNQRRWALGVVLPRVWCEAAHSGDRWRIRTEVVIRADAGATIGGVVRFLAPDGSERAVELATRAVMAGPVETRVVNGAVVVAIARHAVVAGAGLWRVAIAVGNTTPIESRWSRHDALGYALASAHIVAEVAGGVVLSAVDPPADAAEAVAACVQDGVWPAVLGAHTVLAAPIVLPDHPNLAPGSSRRPLAATADPDVAIRRRGLARSVAAGDAVILRPSPRGDILDTVLAGRSAIVESVEHDADGRIHVAVTVDHDPGGDLRAQGLPSYRFFFAPDEIEHR